MTPVHLPREGLRANFQAHFWLLRQSSSWSSSLPRPRHDRIASAGYSPSYSEEIIYGGNGARPQDAFDYWMNEPAHHDVIFDPAVTEIGVGFAHVADSTHGDYFTVDVARP